MNALHPPELERPTLTYCLAGLQPRAELLTKSYMRLLGHLTLHKWVYQPVEAAAQVGLLLATPDAKNSFIANTGVTPVAVLVLGGTGENSHGHLSWPLSPGALEKELNLLGSLVELKTAQAHAAGGGPSLANTTKNRTIAVVAAGQQLHLKQWPPSRFLSGAGRLRLATLLTAKHMTLEELVGHARLPQQLCETFVKELLQAGLLVQSARSAALTKPAIRAISDRSDTSKTSDSGGTASAESQHAQWLRATNLPITPLSLLARIRLRLGIGSS